MAKVYVSSTVADLQVEREAVMDWRVAARHQPVHSYRPNSETVRESCLDDVDGCDLYVLILGHRYGFQPEEDNPEKLSITHLEFRRAKQSGIPCIALLRTSIPDTKLFDMEDPGRAPLVLAFREEVRREVRPAEFSNPHGLIQGLSTGVQSELDRLRSKPSSTTPMGMPDDLRMLQIVATLAERNPANTLWQIDVVVSCAKLGGLAHAQNVEVRRDYLLRGRGILAELKAAGRLLPNQDWIKWFDGQLSQLPPDRS